MKTRTIFMGSDPIALPLLESLAAVEELELVGVFTQPDRQRGRGHKVQMGPIKAWALAQNIPVFQPQKCGPEEEAWLEANQIELILVMAYGQLLKRSLLELPRLGTWNFHASLLPKYRGASPIATAIAEGETETGVTLMQIVPKLDAGPMLDAERVPIAPQATGPAVATLIGAACVPLWQRAQPSILDGQTQPALQDEAAVTYCRILDKDDAALDFAQPATALHHRIRAFQPWPGARVICGEDILKVGQAEAIDGDVQAPPGTIVGEHADGSVDVACGQGHLRLQALQRPGGKMLPTADFRRGYPLNKGKTLTSQPMRILSGPTPFKRGLEIPKQR